MDKQTLKCIIVRLKDEENLSFNEIALRLDKQYDIKMTRQAVYGMYKRAHKLIYHNKELVLISNDVNNLYALGINKQDIYNIVNNPDKVVSLSEIDKILSENEAQQKEIRESQISKVRTLIMNNSSMDVIQSSIEFKGVKPTKHVLDSLIIESCNIIIRDEAIASLRRVYNIVNDREIIKRVAKEMQIPIKEIAK